MKKDKKKEKNDKIKNDLLNILDELKNSDLSDEDKEKLEKLSKIVSESDGFIKKRISMMDVLLLLFKFVITFFISMSLFSLFYVDIILTPVFYILAVGAIISLISTFVSVLTIKNNVKHLFLGTLVYALIIFIICLINDGFIKVFENSFIWIFYIILLDIISNYLFVGILRRIK